MSVFGERVSALLDQLGLSQKELADKAGVTASAMSLYVTGKRIPNSDALARIASALNTTTDYLLDVNTSPQDDKLQYLQRNLKKLDENNLRRAENILKAAFDDIFDDDEGDDDE